MSPRLRVWKGIFGIRDLTKIPCGIRGNAKYLDGIRDLTALWEAGFAKIWARDPGFFCLSVGNSGNRHHPNNGSERISSTIALGSLSM